MNKPKLGIIGGASPQAGALFYKLLIERLALHAKGVPEIVLVNYPFTKGVKADEAKKQERIIEEEIRHCLGCLSNEEVTIAALCCNTLHHFLEKTDKQGVAFVSLPQAVMERAERRGMQRLLLLATETSIQVKVYAHSKLEIIAPLPHEQKEIDAIIDRILKGMIEEEDSACLKRIAVQVRERERLDAIILGCTDFSLLHEKFPIEVQGIATLDSIELGVDKLIQTYSEVVHE